MSSQCRVFFSSLLSLFVALPSFASRTLDIPPVDILNIIDFTREPQGDVRETPYDEKAVCGVQPTPGPSYVPLPQATGVSGIIHIAIQLQNLTAIEQTGTVYLSNLQGGISSVHVPNIRIFGAGIVVAYSSRCKSTPCCKEVTHAVDGGGLNFSPDNMEINWKLLANTSTIRPLTTIRVTMTGQVLFGKFDATQKCFNRGISRLGASIRISVDQDRGAILGTYTSNYGRGAPKKCDETDVNLTSTPLNLNGYVTDMGGSNLTLPLNGGRPF